MFKLDLNSKTYRTKLKKLLKRWNDHSKIIRPLVVVKVSQAFTMYHQALSDNFTVENSAFKNLHPVLINDLETGFNVVLSLDTAGRILHATLIDDYGNLESDDDLLKFAHKNRHQEYLDYFYCINQNIQRHLGENANFNEK